MSCECYQIGGPWITYDPSCPAHGDEAQAEQRVRERQEQEHADVMHCYWIMMTECEALAARDKDATLTTQVEGFYRLWNRVMNDNKRPRWITSNLQF